MYQRITRLCLTLGFFLAASSVSADDKKPAFRSEGGGLVIQTYEVDQIPFGGTKFTATFGRPLGNSLVLANVSGFEAEYNRGALGVQFVRAKAEVVGKDPDKGSVTVSCVCEVGERNNNLATTGKMTVTLMLIGTPDQVVKQKRLEAKQVKPNPSENARVTVLSMPSVEVGLLLKLEPGEILKFDGGAGKGLQVDGDIQFKVWDQATGDEVANYRAGSDKPTEFKNTTKATKYLLVGGAYRAKAGDKGEWLTCQQGVIDRSDDGKKYRLGLDEQYGSRFNHLSADVCIVKEGK